MGRSRTPGIYQTSDDRHEVDAWYKGRRIRQRGFQTFAEAESYLIAEKQRIKTINDGGRPAITLDEAAAHYVGVEAERGKVSLDTEIHLLKSVIATCGQLLLDMVSNQTLKPFVQARLAEGRKRKTINNSLGVVRRICNLAATDWRLDNGRTWLETAPLITMLDLGDQRPPRPFSWKEQRALMPHLPEHLANMVLFDLNAGVRENVVCQMRWDWEIQVPIRPGVVVSVFVVPRQFVKGRKRERIIVCNSVAQSVIEAQRGRHKERVFTYYRAAKADTRKPVTHRPVASMNNTAWQRARDEAGLGDLHVHDIRHTVGMRLREAGVSERTQDEILWHKNGGMTNHYAVAMVAELYDALERIKEPSSWESQNILELVRAQVPQKSPSNKKAA